MSPLRRLLGYMARYRRSFLLGFVCIVLSTGIALAGPWVLKYAIDDLTAGVTMGKVRMYALGLFALTIVGAIFRFLMRRIIIGASRDIEFDLRHDFFTALQRLDLAYFQRNRTGDLMSRATSDLNAVRMMVGPAVMYTATTVLGFIVAVGLMLSIDGRLTLLTLVPLPFVSIIVRYFGSAIHRRFEAIQEQLSEISAQTQETLSAVRVIRAYGQEQYAIERFRLANEEYVRRNKGLIRLQGAYYPSMGLLMGFAAMLVLWLGSREVVAGRMTLGELVAFNAYLMLLSWPMIAFGWVTNLLQRGMASWKRMLEVMDAVPAVADRVLDGVDGGDGVVVGADLKVRPDTVHPDTVPGAIEFRNLTFAYGDHVVLRDVSAVFPAGTTTAIVGATGSGKSTLLGLLPRLHEPPRGTVFIDGVDVLDMPLETLRGAIGFVPQEPFLFSASIAENVAFGARGAQGDRDRVEEAAGLARLDKDLSDFPKGYDTLVGERGITLSGGQKQRTAIARALAIDPRILVMDDALSSVDTYTEEEILSRLAAVMRERTTILVSHRVSTVRGADQILVLDDGRIVERGTHDALVRHNGLYADLYRKQLLEEELEAS
ncbi:MAG: ABC transporter ATP-binding protein [Vicinamibacterales bacterium]